MTSRYWDYEDSSGNRWQTIVERSADGVGVFVREGMMCHDGRWLVYPSVRHESLPEALGYVERVLDMRQASVGMFGGKR